MQNESRNPLIDVEDWVSWIQLPLTAQGNQNLFQITTPLFLLMLTGRASPFLHNGIMEVDNLRFNLGLDLTFFQADESDAEGGYIFTEGKVVKK